MTIGDIRREMKKLRHLPDDRQIIVEVKKDNAYTSTLVGEVKTGRDIFQRPTLLIKADLSSDDF